MTEPFSTRTSASLLADIATIARDAKVASNRLGKAGCSMIAPPESFFIASDRPRKGVKRRLELDRLEDGELQRAETWGRATATLAFEGQPHLG